METLAAWVQTVAPGSGGRQCVGKEGGGRTALHTHRAPVLLSARLGALSALGLSLPCSRGQAAWSSPEATDCHLKAGLLVKVFNSHHGSGQRLVTLGWSGELEPLHARWNLFIIRLQGSGLRVLLGKVSPGGKGGLGRYLSREQEDFTNLTWFRWASIHPLNIKNLYFILASNTH